MKPLPPIITEFLKGEDGPTIVEYAVMLTLLVVVCMTAIGSIGTKVADMYAALDQGMPDPG